MKYRGCGFRAARFAGLLATLVAFALAPSPARAQVRRGSLVVLGLRSPTGDDEAAAQLTDGLRRAGRNAGFDIPNDSPALEQSVAAFGCDDSVPADCLAQIAGDLHASRMLYGEVRRQGRRRDAPLRVAVNLYDNESHSTTTRQEVTVTRAQAQNSEVLRQTASQLIDQLLPPPSPLPSPSPSPPPAPSSPPPESVPVRTHAVAPLEPVPAPTARAASEPSSAVLYTGIGLVVVGVGFGIAAGVLTANWWGLQGTLAHGSVDNPDTNAWNQYSPGVTDPYNGYQVCDAARSGQPSRNADPGNRYRAAVVNICSTEQTLRVGGWVSMGVGITAAAIGGVLIATHLRGSASRSRREHSARARALPVALWPVLTPTYQGGALTLQF